MTIKTLLDVLIPRFITEDVALVDTGDHYDIVCSVADLEPYEIPDAVATMRVFNFFGLGLFPRMIGEPRPCARPTGRA